MTDRSANAAHGSLAAPILGLCFLAALLLGVAPLLAVAIITLCAGLVLGYVALGGTLPRAGLLILGLYGYSLFSAIVFGGIDSLTLETAARWVEGEGRFFLTFWPFLALLAGAPRMATAPADLDILVGILAWLALAAVLLRMGTEIRLYSSHHGAGAITGTLALFGIFALRDRPSLGLGLATVAALIALLGSGSRTAVLAVACAVSVVFALSHDWKSALKVGALGAMFAAVMSFAFADQYARLSGSGNGATVQAMAVSFAVAATANPPAESDRALAVLGQIDVEQNANLAIRGYLWGRAWREFLTSPFAGSGFGRYNDTGRYFTPFVPGITAATDARVPNPDQHSAHNSFLQFAAELGGLGLGLVLLAALSHWRLFSRSLNTEKSRFHGELGLALVAYLGFSSLTQHALGAPIYGLTSLALLGLISGEALSKSSEHAP